MNEDIPFSRIVRSDYGALLPLLISPMGFVFVLGKWKRLSGDERGWALGIAGAVAMLCFFLVWRRVRGIRETINSGMRVPGRIASVWIHEDRGRLEFEYQYAGPRKAGVAINRNADTAVLAAGFPIDLVLNPERPDEPLVLGLYSRDGFLGLEQARRARDADEDHDDDDPDPDDEDEVTLGPD